MLHVQAVAAPGSPAKSDGLLGDYTNAAAAFDRALAIVAKAHGNEHPLVVHIQNSRAKLWLRQNGDYLKAQSLLNETVQTAEKLFGAEHPLVLGIWRNLVDSYIVQGDLSKAVTTFSEIFRRERLYQAGQFLSFEGSLILGILDRSSYRSEIFHTLCSASAEHGFTRAKALGAQQSAFRKAALEEVRATQAALESDPRTGTQELRDQYQSIEMQLARLPETTLDPAQRDVRRREFQSELSQLQGKLAERVGLVAQRLRERDLTLADVARVLPSEAVLVDFVGYRRFDFAAKTDQWKEERYTAYLTFPLADGSTNVIVERIDLGEAAPINERVDQVSKLMASGQIAPRRLQPVLQRLGDLVYAPLAKHLTNVSHLIVCPDGQLSRVPFEMLLHDGKYVVEEKTVSYVTSGREVVRLGIALSRPAATLSPQVGERAGRGVVGKSLVMGDPDFDLDLGSVRGPRAVADGASVRSAGSSRGDKAHSSNSERGTQNAEHGQSLLTSAATRSLSRSYRRFKFTRLPNAADEARSVAKLLSGDAVLRLGKEARESELKQIVSPRVLHLATHGFFLSDQEFKQTNAPMDFLATRTFETSGGFTARRSLAPPGNDWENPMIRCGIALAGANNANWPTGRAGSPPPADSPSATDGAHGVTRPTWDVEDGLLTGLEASLLDLQGTELVILSACDTGQGDIKIGEGVMSLRRAFRIAGAETVLASHWKVSDKATSQLMTEFMRRWKAGEPRAKAWREAQLPLLRSKDYASPFFWASFTLTGRWE